MTSVLYPDLPDTGNPGYWKLRNGRSSSDRRDLRPPRAACVRLLGWKTRSG